ncbi:hypothetical protein PCH_Pc13g10960 [Penicillium rubens Wisconsin 54-1255]|uniref:Uncharacterized protein n=1 Tax=Penicillium rubens (strain ATCC 28089 / DSM 1075 / NRRL 1951 / Wisconsin 54-1255) TaxID=500485 RepID=B6H3X1_PENRW|nr:hypothetical protein PCH_Pc13g10960 [Penicillium rubens Wisconsin 54-1255]
MAMRIISRIPWTNCKSNIHAFSYSRPQHVSFFASSRLGQHYVPRSPELYTETKNGKDEKITEEALHRYTRHRWLNWFGLPSVFARELSPVRYYPPGFATYIF